MTARHAVSVLVHEGLVFRVQGKGTFVARNKVVRGLEEFSGLYDDLISQGLNPGSRVLHLRRRLANDLERSELDLGLSPEVWDVKRIRAVNGVPIALQEFVVPVDLVPHLDEIDLAKRSFYGYLRDIGLPLVGARQRIEAVCDPDVSQLLEVSGGSPLLRVERVSYLEDGRAVERLVSNFLGDAYSYEANLGSTP